MTAQQVYEQTIRPLSTQEKLTIARLILSDIAPDTATAEVFPVESSFDRLKRLLPQIERLSLTDEDLAGVTLTGSQT